MPKASKPNAQLAEMRKEFLSQCEELWSQHQSEFMGVLEDSESRKIKLSYGVTLDFSESKASLETTMGFSQVVKDKRQRFFDDPDQMGLNFTHQQAAPPAPDQPELPPGEQAPETAEQELAAASKAKGKDKKKSPKKKK